jgi:ATP-dependent Lon protease
MEARRRVREHILRIDDTFKRNDFCYRPLAGDAIVKVLTPEEIQYPTFAAPPTKNSEEDLSESAVNDPVPATNEVAQDPTEITLQPGHIVVPENSKGWSYRRMFAQHLKGARKITISDPYVRLFYQVRNMMEFLEMAHEITPESDEVAVHLITQSDVSTYVKQDEYLNQVVTAFTGSRVTFSWTLDPSPNFHARSIVTDTGWKISIDRGLDLFQKFEAGTFSIELAIQEERLTRGAEITYLRI